MAGSSPYLLQPGQMSTNGGGAYGGPVAPSPGGGSSMNPYDPSSNPYANADPYGNADINTQTAAGNNNWQTMAGNGSASASWGGAVDTLDQNPLATPAGQYMQAQQAGSQQAQQQSYLQAQQLAQGKGPSLATSLLQQNANQAMGNQNAMASSASGSGAGAARRQAMMSNAQTMQGLGGAAATARAQEQLGAMQMQGQIAGQSRAQDLALAGGETGMVQNQANLNLGEQGLQQQQQQYEQGREDKYIGAITSGVGAMMGFDAHLGGGDAQAPGPTGSSLHLKEPNGPSHWILREEPNFLLAVNARTGEHRKILTAPLTPDEHRQATAKHGAGPMGSYNPGNIYTGDFDMAQMSQWSGAGQDNTGPASSYPPPAASQTNNQNKPPQAQSRKGQAGKLIAGNQPGQMSGSAKDYMVDLQKSPLQGADVNLGSSGGGTDYAQQFRQSYDSADDSTPAAKAGQGSTNNSIGALTGADVNLGRRRLTPQDDEVVQSAMDNADPNVSPNAGYVPMEYWGKYLEGKPAPADYNWVNGPHRGSKQIREAAYEPQGIQRKEKGGQPTGDYNSPNDSLRAADANLGGSPPPGRPMTGADTSLAGMGYNPNGYGLRQTQPDIYKDDKAAAALIQGNKQRDLAVKGEAARLKDEDVKSQKDVGDAIVQPPSYYEHIARGEPTPQQDSKFYRDSDPGIQVGGKDVGDYGIYDTDKAMGTGVDEQGEPVLNMRGKTISPSNKKVADPGAPIAADLHIGGRGYHPTRPQVGKNPLASMMPKTGGGTRGLTSFYMTPKLDKVPKVGTSLMTQKFGKKSKAA